MLNEIGRIINVLKCYLFPFRRQFTPNLSFQNEVVLTLPNRAMDSSPTSIFLGLVFSGGIPRLVSVLICVRERITLLIDDGDALKASTARPSASAAIASILITVFIFSRV
jgi:hypothetical protein